jgi:hypothetical protein
MDELKELLALVEKLPSLALWVLAMVFAYKALFIGSVYGLIRFTVKSIHDYLTRPPPTRQWVLCVKPIDEATGQALNAQLMRLCSTYAVCHMSSVQALSKAVDIVLKGEDKK